MIEGIAILYNGVIYKLPKPNRHHNVIRFIAQTNGVGIRGRDVQGFYNDKGEFLTRREALDYAAVSNQIISKTHPQHLLFSEDLW